MENERAAQSEVADAIRQTLGATVRKHRNQRQWSQEDLARRLTDSGFPMHQTTVAKLEGGSRPTSVDELYAIAAIFDIDTRELIRQPANDDAVQRVQQALVEVQEIKAQIRAINLEIEELMKRKKALGPARSEALKRYHAARKAAGMPMGGRAPQSDGDGDG